MTVDENAVFEDKNAISGDEIFGESDNYDDHQSFRGHSLSGIDAPYHHASNGDRWAVYECCKRLIADTAASALEYERRLMDLAFRLGV